MEQFLTITEKDHPTHFNLLNHMELEKQYTFQQLSGITGLKEFTVKNNLGFLRSTINFKFKGEVHHISLSQMTRKTFAYILRKGEYIKDDYYLPQDELSS